MNKEPYIRIIDPTDADSIGGWTIWLDPDESGRCVGLCIGTGKTKQAALRNALRTLSGAPWHIKDLLTHHTPRTTNT